MNRALTLLILCILCLLPSCLATTGDVDASRENTRDLVKKQTEETVKLVADEQTPQQYMDNMGKALNVSDEDWDGRAPEGKGWLALAIGPAAAAAVYGLREFQRRRDLKSVEATDRWVAEVEAKVDGNPASVPSTKSVVA